ncbi:MAG: hypothetical protein ISR70_02400 [Candidatus Thioglobus sp.]|nr:hypothetical protein [Candidatus Thioglobus pontius]MBL6976894.1 hypothetical protein [Candidatus Thioglobus sp.]MBL6984612.1 hypothetical protein [Candidatus Thioglobus sp.]
MSKKQDTIKHQKKVKRTAMNNPDLSIDVVEKLLIALNEPSEPFEFID